MSKGIRWFWADSGPDPGKPICYFYGGLKRSWVFVKLEKDRALNCALLAGTRKRPRKPKLTPKLPGLELGQIKVQVAPERPNPTSI